MVTADTIKAINCETIKGTPHEQQMLPTIREYFQECYKDFDPAMTDEELFAFSYRKARNGSPDDPLMLQQVRKEYLAWQEEDEDEWEVPAHICSSYRNALLHQLAKAA